MSSGKFRMAHVNRSDTIDICQSVWSGPNERHCPANFAALNRRHDHEARHPAHRRRPAQSDRRRHRRQPRQGARRPGRRRRARAPTSCLTELFIAGYPPEDLVLKPAFQDACREGRGGRLPPTPPTAARASSSARRGAQERQALQRRRAARWRQDRARRYKVELPNYGVFDEKRVFQAGPLPGPVVFRGVRHRRADLRGHLGRVGVCESLAETRRGNAARAQRLALLPRQDRRRHQVAIAPRRRTRAAAHLCQPVRRPGRAGLRRRLLRLNGDGSAGLPDAAVRGRGRCHDLDRQGDRLALLARAAVAAARGATRPTIAPACWACATTSTRTASRRRARPFRRHRLGDLRGHCRRRARRGARPTA